FAEQARDRLLHEAKAVFHERRFDVPNPNFVRCDAARVFVLMIDHVNAAAAALLRGAPRRDRVVERSGNIGRTRVDRADADAARARDLLVSDAEDLRTDLADEILGPDLDVAR